MSIGTFRHRITIQELSEVPDGGYSITASYNDIVDLWAEIPEGGAGEVFFDGKQTAEVNTTTFKIRYYPEYSITSENWVIYRSQRYRIRTVSPVQEREWFTILSCEKAFNEGAYGP